MSVILTFAAVIPFLPIVSFFVYGAFALAAARRERHAPAGGVAVTGADDLFFVFVVPCLNEELVIGPSLDRLLGFANRAMAVVVIDDGSDDATARIVRGYAERDPRVRLLQRRPPEARKGKGAALNAAYRYLRSSGLVAATGRDIDRVIVVVVDADGRLQPDTLTVVAPLFADRRTAAVQIGVRMYNRGAGWLARMQDMEFLVFTEIFQRARHRYGNAGLGGNGQFVRLGALDSLGAEPWTDYLTEDLDMGLRLQSRGWRTSFTPHTYVDQEGLTSLRPLMRQRTRWYQGHLQCWSRLADVLACRELSVGRTVDLVVYLVSPITVLLITLSLVAYLPRQIYVLATQWQAAVDAALAHHGLLLWWYLVVLAVIPLIAVIYWRASNRAGPDVSLPRALLYSALFTAYAYVWLPVGWRATWRLLRGRRGWTKTLRLGQPAATDAGRPVLPAPRAATDDPRPGVPESPYVTRS
ncbi:glycosyltransferase family 2 protein [Nucisporomicrobium flavum]|uniref:glycosyltransferase family 2 protein n=1 Tax=Nucisporomicrobium flavum TaxID=2785915 RepID=UPI0018F466FB|nr:glycosyltransferase family 2 protein [Nucisporomicrobium flavum]